MNLSKKLVNSLATASLLTGLSLTVVSATSTNTYASNNNNDNHIPVTICHATHSETNPYNKQTVDDDAVDGNGNGNADHNRDDHQDGEDIIPAGVWDQDGRNWDTLGQAIWNNNCNIPTVTVTPTPTGQASLTPTPTGTIDEECPRTCTNESTPTPTPTQGSNNNQNNNGDSIVQSASGSKPADPVVPAKAMASTGNITSLFANASMIVGAVMSAFALKGYEKKKK